MREKAIIIFFCLCLSLCLISVTGGAWQRELRIMGEIKTDNWPLPPAATPEVPPAVTTPVDPLPEPAPTPEPEAGITPDPVVGELPEPERGEELEADVPPKSTPEPTLESPLIEEGDSAQGRRRKPRESRQRTKNREQAWQQIPVLKLNLNSTRTPRKRTWTHCL